MSTVLEELVSFGEDLLTSGIDGHRIQGAESVISQLMRDAAAVSPDLVGGGTAVDVEIASTALDGLLGVVVVPLYLVYSMTIAAIRDSLYGVVDRLPGFARGVARLFIDAVLAQFPSPSHLYDRQVSSFVDSIIPSLTSLLNLVLPHTKVIHDMTTVTVGGTVNLAPLWNAVGTAESQIGSIEQQISWILGHLGQPTPAPSVNLVPLQDQVNTLRDEITQLKQQVAADHNAIQGLYGLAITLTNDVAQLQAELFGVRSTVTSWPEVQQQLQQQISTTNQSLADTNTRVGEQGDFLAQLAPLAILVTAGAAGIGNLRKLEDNPCQCPQLPGLPGDMAAMLSLYAFVTHG